MAKEILAERLEPSALHRRPHFARAESERTDELARTRTPRERAATRLWERYLVNAVNSVIPDTHGANMAMQTDGKNFLMNMTPVSGVFLDNPRESDSASLFVNSYRLTHPDRNVYVIPAHLPLIEVGFQQHDTMEQNRNRAHIIGAYQREGQPKIHEAGEDADPQRVASVMMRKAKNTGEQTFNKLWNAVMTGAPVFSDRTTDRLLVVSSAVPIPELENISITTEEIDRTEAPAPNSNVIFFEGAQGTGKTTQATNLREALRRHGVQVAEPLPPDEDPMQILKGYESTRGQLTPYPDRQRIVLASLGQRTTHMREQSGSVGLGDRSPVSAALTGVTTARLAGGTDVDQFVDAKITSHWLERYSELFDGLTVVLELEDIYRSFFRMRQDLSTDNQQSDFATQFLEHIFYKTLVRQGRGISVDVGGNDLTQATNAIQAAPEFAQVLQYVEAHRNTRESIKNWWGEEERVGVWFSTRLASEMSDYEVKLKAKHILNLSPDMLFVGAASGITTSDQERVIRLCMEARSELEKTDQDIKIVDFPSDPSYIAGNADFSVVMRYLNTNDLEVDKARVGTALKKLRRDEIPYIVAGYGLFDNGTTELPSVAYTGNVLRPWPANRPYLAEDDIMTGVPGVDLVYFDRGSDPSETLPDTTVQELVNYCRDSTQGKLPPIMIGGGFTDREQSVLSLPGVTTLALEEYPNPSTGTLQSS